MKRFSKYKKKWIIILLLLFMTALLSGCSQKEEMVEALTDAGLDTESIHPFLMATAQEAYAVFEAIDNMLDLAPSGYENVSSVKAVNDGCNTLGQALMAVFITIQLMTELNRKGDDFRWEDGARLAAEFVVLKLITDMYRDILSAMFQSAGELYNSGSAGGIKDIVKDIIADAVGTVIEDNSDKGFLSKNINMFFSMTGITLLNVLLLGLGIVVAVILVCRVVQIALMTIMAAIPISFIVWSETRDISKRFFLSYFSVCLQGTIIYLAFGLFEYTRSTLLPDAGLNGTIGSLLSIIILATCVVKSGSWAKELLGVA